MVVQVRFQVTAGTADDVESFGSLLELIESANC